MRNVGARSSRGVATGDVVRDRVLYWEGTGRRTGWTWLGRLMVAGTLLAALFAATRDDTHAQIIPIKTVPVATGDQFLVHPSARPGMGGAGLAIDDTVSGPFRNPALGARVVESVFFGAPILYGISDDNGSGRTLPLGALIRGEEWFAAASLALQQLSAARTDPVFFCEVCLSVAPPELLSERSARNLYFFGSIGKEMGDGLSIGVSASYADLRWMSGIEHLYAGSQRIIPRGHTSAIRMGALKQWRDGRELDLVLFRSVTDMEHDVMYVDWWPRPLDPVRPEEDPLPPERAFRLETNLDHTNTWGGEVRYRLPVQGSDWSITTAGTLNRADHPKIPNYRIQDIPRDPGETWALGLALGAARSLDGVTFTVEAAYQPIWSDTWQEADVAVPAAGGRTIPKGGRTIENDFQFDNVLVRSGLDRDFPWGDVQLGLEARSIQYTLDQVDWIEGSSRIQDESWIEWSPTASASLDLDGLTLRYFGKRTAGAGRPGTGVLWDRFESADAAAPSIGILAAPRGPLTLQEASVWTHQVVVTLPIR